MNIMRKLNKMTKIISVFKEKDGHFESAKKTKKLTHENQTALPETAANQIINLAPDS